MSGIEVDEWNLWKDAKVYYSSAPLASPSLLRRIVRRTAPDMLYLNSFFSTTTIAVLFLRRLGILPRLPVLLAPRGEFSQGALWLKSAKKQAYIAVARRLGLFAGVAWHVSSATEAADLRRVFLKAENVYVAPNLLSSSGDAKRTIQKRIDNARLVHIARITPKKNLLGAIQYLQSMSGKLTFHIYGPIEDRQYWSSCLDAASRLPGNVEFSYRGELPHHRVAETFADYHFMLLPTLGENFGHSIAEELQQGCPVLVSDQTPWRNLKAAGVGWDLSLDEPGQWSRALEECLNMDNEAYQEMSQRCRGFAENWVTEQGGRDANLRMFRAVAASRSDS
jgi:glycosyltransferase involved in cell wall biosynthesis